MKSSIFGDSSSDFSKGLRLADFPSSDLLLAVPDGSMASGSCPPTSPCRSMDPRRQSRNWPANFGAGNRTVPKGLIIKSPNRRVQALVASESRSRKFLIHSNSLSTPSSSNSSVYSASTTKGSPKHWRSPDRCFVHDLNQRSNSVSCHVQGSSSIETDSELSVYNSIRPTKEQLDRLNLLANARRNQSDDKW